MEQILDEVLHEIKNTLINKNQEYGDSFHKTLEEYGLISVIIRLTDKLNRLKFLYQSGASAYDTLLDIAGYAILTLVEIKRKTNQERRY